TSPNEGLISKIGVASFTNSGEPFDTLNIVMKDGNDLEYFP
ncbi:unnamed protein product, partial [marine sediment metagenome]